MRFEAYYYEGERNERSPSWQVVEWTTDTGAGHRSGRTVQLCVSEAEAMELAEILNREHAFGEQA
jgi:hypothetical protein